MTGMVRVTDAARGARSCSSDPLGRHGVRSSPPTIGPSPGFRCYASERLLYPDPAVVPEASGLLDAAQRRRVIDRPVTDGVAAPLGGARTVRRRVRARCRPTRSPP